jgi:hypothetical protein
LKLFSDTGLSAKPAVFDNNNKLARPQTFKENCAVDGRSSFGGRTQGNIGFGLIVDPDIHHCIVSNTNTDISSLVILVRTEKRNKHWVKRGVWPTYGIIFHSHKTKGWN